MLLVKKRPMSSGPNHWAKLSHVNSRGHQVGGRCRISDWVLTEPSSIQANGSIQTMSPTTSTV